MSQPEGGSPEFDFTPKPSGRSGAASYARRKRRRSPLAVLAPFLLIGALAAGGLVAFVLLRPAGDTKPAILLQPIADQHVAELDTLLVDASAKLTPGCKGNAVYWLVDAPEGAVIDGATGRFTWHPGEAEGPGQYAVTIGVALDSDKGTQAESRFVIHVTEENRPPAIESVSDQEIQPGETLSLEIAATDPDEPAARIRYQLMPGAPEGAAIDPHTGRFEWTPGESAAGEVHEIMIEAAEAVQGGLASRLKLHVAVARPPKPEMKPEPAVVEAAPVVEDPVEVAESPETHGNEMILELYEKRKLFHPAQYTTLRKIFAERFAMAHAAEIRTAWGEDAEALGAWLDEHVDIQEVLYTAIDPEVDNVPAALGLFREMWKLSPERLEDYGNLAIAVAVTWDQEDGGVYDYGGHQGRVRSTMPAGLLGAIDNYKYIVQAEKVMQGWGQFLPWEFLVHVVNHKTPLDERQWAMQRFLPERAMIGKCYSKVPYDGEMLASKGEVVRLAGKPYTLPNLLTYGGVCSMQADFASRVGKSLGVPAAYVSGENRFGGLHAWVMWVELKVVTRKGIGFSLESHGRYRGDRYYVGNLKDPKTARSITDRQLELRLHTIGLDPLAKRQADMIMAVYPMLREYHQMEVGDQLSFLDQLIRLCPGSEAAWQTIAGMSRDGVVTKAHTKMMMGIVNGLFVTFAAFPDFTWEVFDDLISFQDLPKQRAMLFGQLTELYERAGRPDLSCKARLRYTDYLVDDERQADAIQGLAASIMRFPEEGRYVPMMLDRLEQLCDQTGEAGPQVMSFYRQFLPLVPAKRGNRPSSYCMEMYDRAIQRFRQYGQEAVAQQLEMQLAALKAAEIAKP